MKSELIVPFIIIYFANPLNNAKSPPGLTWIYSDAIFDPKNKLYAVFMARLYPYNGKTQTEFRKAVYAALK